MRGKRGREQGERTRLMLYKDQRFMRSFLLSIML